MTYGNQCSSAEYVHFEINKKLILQTLLSSEMACWQWELGFVGMGWLLRIKKHVKILDILDLVGELFYNERLVEVIFVCI